MKFIIIAILTLFVQTSLIGVQGQESQLKLQFIGKEYDKLNLVFIDYNFQPTTINGESIDGNTWIFTYPDSIYDKHNFALLRVPTGIDTLVHEIGASVLVGDDTIRIGNIAFSKRYSSIRLVLQETTLEEKVPFYLMKDLIYDRYFVSMTEDKELHVDVLAQKEKLVVDLSDILTYDKKEYQNYINHFASFILKYPDSHYTLTALMSEYNYLRTKEDIQKLLNCFSLEQLNSIRGLTIQSYLNANYFEDMNLPLWDTQVEAPILEKNKKYNLVCFSASWCVPCHNEIPLLKKIYNDLKDNLEITYVSLDEKKTIKQWYNTMIKKEIPWRSVLAYNEINEIKKKYLVLEIPHCILVYPNNKMEKIDIRYEDQKMKLYEIVKE